MSDLLEFKDTGKRMLLAWQEGVNGLRDRRVYSVGDWAAGKVFEGISDVPRLESLRKVVDRSPLLGGRSKDSRKRV
jgi:serine/threonine-protein kinase HipA